MSETPPLQDQDDCVRLFDKSDGWELFISLDVETVEDDWLNYPSYFCFLQVPSAMLTSTESVLSTSVGSSVPRVCRKRARSMKRSSKESSKKKAKVGVEKLKKHNNKGVPIARDAWIKEEGPLTVVSGKRMTCQPDTVCMVLKDLGIAGETLFSVRNALMPDWLRCEAVSPGLDKVRDFYSSKGLKMVLRRDLASNPLAILRQDVGVFHLSVLLTVQHDDVSETMKHACLYNASKTFRDKAGRGVLKDNQKDVKPLLIEDSDRVDKTSALTAFHQFWSGCSKVLIVVVHEIKK